MDISDLERKLGIDGISAEQQMEIISALQQSAAEKIAKAKSESIGKGAELVIQGLKKIKSDMEQKFAQLNGEIQSKVASIQNGQDGKDGKDGRDGKQGPAGATGATGRDGSPGRDGVDGANGVGVASARIDFDGSLVIVLDNGSEINAGEVVPFDIAERIKVITNGGGTSQYVLDTLTSLQTQINALGSIPSQTGNAGKYLTTDGSTLSWDTISGALNYQGTWNASTNTPTLTSSSGTKNYYYIVSVSGSTNLNGITDWVVGDWAIYNGTAWQKIDQTNLVESVNGQTGVVNVGTVTSVSGTSPVASSGGNTPSISLSAAYGDTLNPYASKTAKFVLAAPNAANGVPTFRALAASDIPTLNQNTTGSAATLTTGRTISITGDLTYTSPSFNGSANITAAGTLSTVNANIGSFTNASVTVNGKGLVTAVSSGTAPVTSVSATSPIESSGGTTPGISLSSGYGDTQNPFASKTANYFLAAPNGLAGSPTFRAIVAADIPTLNQNTTGTAANITATTNSTLTTLSSLSLPGSQVSGNISGNAANVTGTVAIANGGTGATSAPAAMANLMGYTTTATAAGTTTLDNTSSYYQIFTGTTTQTIVLPVTSTLQTGWTFHICNNSTGALTVNSSDGTSLVITVIAGTTVMCTCIGTTLTTAADWEAGYTDFSTATGTGAVVLGTSPTIASATLTAPTATGVLTFSGTSGSASNFHTTQTSGVMTIGGTASTGNMVLGRSTATQTTSIQAGATASGNTKTINIGTAGLSGSTTSISIGSAVSGATSTTTLNGTVTLANALAVSSGGTGVTTSTGTGSVVLSTSPTLVTPILGTPTSGTLTNCTFPTLNQNTTGSAGSLATTNFTIVESGGKLLFKYGATTIASMDSTGVITSVTNIVANGTP